LLVLNNLRECVDYWYSNLVSRGRGLRVYSRHKEEEAAAEEEEREARKAREEREEREEREAGVTEIHSRHSHVSCYFLHNLSFSDIKGSRL
jgi:hypothetical protein